MKLTHAQKREYDLLKTHGSVYVAGQQRRRIFEKLKEMGLAINDDYYWFHINKNHVKK